MLNAIFSPEIWHFCQRYQDDAILSQAIDLEEFHTEYDLLPCNRRVWLLKEAIEAVTRCSQEMAADEDRDWLLQIRDELEAIREDLSY